MHFKNAAIFIKFQSRSINTYASPENFTARPACLLNDGRHHGTRWVRLLAMRQVPCTTEDEALRDDEPRSFPMKAAFEAL